MDPTAGVSSFGHGDLHYVSLLDLEEKVIKKEDIGYGKCRRVNDFEKLNRIGEGTYGIVYRAKDTKSGQIVALKKVRIEHKPGEVSMPVSAIREISSLMTLRHENVVKLHEVAVGRAIDSMFLVMEYCEQDLASLLDHMKAPFTEAQVKCILIQLFKGVGYLHENFIVHRDLKVSNLLLTDTGILKVADFGLARTFGDPPREMTPRVVTLWYRAPELLLDSSYQTTGIDMWACGCIMGELLIHRPLVPGKSELDQIRHIINMLGTPNVKIWPDMENLPALKQFDLPVQKYNRLRKMFPDANAECLGLLNGMFMYDPKRRWSAPKCLNSPYFDASPLPCDPSVMPSFPQHRNRK
ncbi:hypothetical protein QR680_013527 [Steinernema hermaphroditum]|uniref:Protein kinase domain-containing protein n=1 Tax=Steinernema hermaphroditum TaxID=289476 RepID=A0AA39M2N0_9BILA|nr:hypothetical protein QR680_013527 [Steinernema hermaphroditum]